MEIKSLNYDLVDWEEAFNKYREYEKLYGRENIQLVVSTHPYTPGYWIEKRGNEYSKLKDFPYVDKEVYDLEERVRQGIEKKGNHHNGVIL